MTVPIAMTREQQALQASLRGWAQLAGPLAMVRAMEPAAGHGLPTAGTAEGEATCAFLLTRCLSIVSEITRILPNQAARLVILPGERERLLASGWEVADASALAAVGRTLADAGVAYKSRHRRGGRRAAGGVDAAPGGPGRTPVGDVLWCCARAPPGG